MHTPAVWHVVKDGTGVPFVIDPSQEGNRVFGVQATAIGKEDVAVSSSVELVRTITCTVWTSDGTDVAKNSASISAETDVFALCSTVKWENSYSLSFHYGH